MKTPVNLAPLGAVSRSRQLSRGYRFASVAAVSLSIAAAITLAVARPLHINRFPSGLPLMTDAGWRVLMGQVPHNDFYTHVGALTSYVVAAGMIVSSSVHAIIFGSIAVQSVVVAALLWFGQSRFTPGVLSVVAVQGGLATIAPRVLGDEVHLSAYDMIYNRWFEAAMALLFVLLLLPPDRRQSTTTDRAEQVFVGGLICALLLQKVNYLALGLGCVGASVFAYRRSRTQMAWMIGGFVAGIAVILVGFGIEPSAWLADLRLVLGAQSPEAKWSQLSGKIQYNALILAAPAVCFLLSRSIAQSPAMTVSDALVMGLGIGGGVSTLAGNAQGADLFLPAVGSLILVESARRRMHHSTVGNGAWMGRLTQRVLILALGLLAIAPLVSIGTRDAASVARVAWRAHQIALASTDVDRFAATRLASVVLDAGEPFVDYVNDGIRLLEAHQVAERGGRVLVLDRVNPFTFALGTVPPRGDAVWWHEDKTISRGQHPAGERVFRDVQFILIPRGSDSSPTTRLLREIYDSQITSSYVEAGMSERWTLLERRAGTSASTSRY